MEWKFRGFDAVGSKGWVYGDLVHNKKCNRTEPFLTDRVMVGGYEVVPDSAGLCTGAKDDTGTELYEGDICRISCYGRVFDARIVYIDFKAAFYFNDEGSTYPMDYASTIRKIGTIYENKELLK